MATRRSGRSTRGRRTCSCRRFQSRSSRDTPPMIASTYLRNVAQTFRTYKSLGERSLAQVPDAHLNTQLETIDNSIAVIVKHVAGNLRSRYTDFLTSDGEKPDRHRDAEFEIAEPASREQLLAWWNSGWTI